MSVAPEARLERMLKEHQFRLVRQSSHLIYRNPDGRIFVTSSTPSDTYHWADRALACLKRVLAAPPRSEVLSIEDYKQSEAAIQLQKQEKPKPGISNMGGGGSNGNGTGGSGFTYYGENDEQPKRLTKKEKRLKKEREDAAAAERERLRILAESKNREEKSRARREKYEARCQELAAIEAARLAKEELERPVREFAAALDVALKRNDKFLLGCIYEDLDEFKIAYNDDNERLYDWILERMDMLIDDFMSTENHPVKPSQDWIMKEDDSEEVDVPLNATLWFNKLGKSLEKAAMEEYGESKHDPEFPKHLEKYVMLNIEDDRKEYNKSFQKFRSLAKSLNLDDINDVSKVRTEIIKVRTSIESACDGDKDFAKRTTAHFKNWLRLVWQRRKAVDKDFPDAERRWLDYYNFFDKVQEVAKTSIEHVDLEVRIERREELLELLKMYPNFAGAARFELDWARMTCHCGEELHDSVIAAVLNPCPACSCNCASSSEVKCGWKPGSELEEPELEPATEMAAD